jgi:hypothetical protein
MLVALAALLVLGLRQPLPAWERVAVAGLALGTIVTARNGLWLALFVAPLAAAGLRQAGALSSIPVQRALGRGKPLPGLLLLGGAVAAVTLAVLRDPVTIEPVAPQVISRVAQVAGDEPVLAPEPAVESFAQAGTRVWVSDPIDAFPRAYQGQYLDFLAGRAGGRPLLERAQIVAVQAGSAPARLVEESSGLVLLDTVDEWRIYRRQ